MAEPEPGNASPKELVLCFDGTGYKFTGDESDSNVLKIYRMLEHSDARTYHYFQPGFGTLVSSTWMSHSGRTSKARSVLLKAKDAAIGTTFAQHVMGGYIFLMRYYSPGDRIFFFAFSRGAYVARFLAEMLDTVGLIKRGNEDLVRFAWMTFSKWQRARNKRDADPARNQRLYEYIQAFRETFTCQASPVYFLGLFDTVNSTPALEGTWIQRSKLARCSAKIIRHAVGIDERRARFRHDLISDFGQTAVSWRARTRQRLERHHIRLPRQRGFRFYYEDEGGRETNTDSQQPPDSHDRPRVQSENPYDERSDGWQDIEEVWFPGCHADIGGGFKLSKDEEMELSHVPLVWMVQEAQRVGLKFDQERLKKFNCCEDYDADRQDRPPSLSNDANRNGDEKGGNTIRLEDGIRIAAERGHIHDCLEYGKGVPWLVVLSWRALEYLPFRRMSLQQDGSWKPVRFPLPLGEVRDIPKGSKVHVSAIRRMMSDPTYRPGNLIEGGGGRGKRRVPPERGIGEWKVAGHAGSPVRETYRRKEAPQ
ncbi:hypothetical protein ASPVEDRAFT_167855 [Aspergillus versicolor CBS 583.65]|uniref:T6SS Phospholipase effector Tle1-like catalytic domain-containing protein n=1 Tax=Aspergillus versicolor CBS 583.65 TaxID=1036611 RepID=A0A1L9PJQ7_ASPVE|nr:uncharacterized protein ASPVEDRAFT_167855 [Aspergillus versicolor CBS 583.65]OJJ01758.1 hypothetical protein ASPVEDRAFT_167855 [Aspergillus versicolor CBS 583.65]